MLLDHCYAFGLLLLSSGLKKNFLEEVDPLPRDLFLSRPGSAPSQYDRNMHMQVHEHFIPTKFRKHPSSGSVVKADYVFPYNNMH